MEKNINLKKDYIWNFAGSIAFAAMYPLLTIAISNILDSSKSGLFSVGFVTAQLFMILGNYAVRVFQVSDLEEKFSYVEYVVCRLITCVVMLISNTIFCLVRSYDKEVFALFTVLCACKMVDAFSDVFEARLQQKGYLYKAGQALFFRTVAGLFVFLVFLYFSKQLLAASVGMLCVDAICMIIFAIIPANKFSEKAYVFKWVNVIEVLKQCFPMFVSLFLFTFIINSPKYALEDHMAYSYQTIFNALYFPAQVIYLLTGFIFKPLIVSMTDMRNNKNKELLKFSNKIIVSIFALTIIGCVAIIMPGIPILEFLYDISLNGYEKMAVAMMINGGIIAVINYFYHVLVILRKQMIASVIYVIVFLLSVIVPDIMIKQMHMWGCVLSYLVVLICLALPILVIGYMHMANEKEEKTHSL
ncbi:MAG: hypothetical protein IKJ73_09960 [Lachnospiraceae bacterium]|nr:hypothetical protein [Lachnospiraceae bacterium]